MTKTTEPGFGIKQAISDLLETAARKIGRKNEQYALAIATELSQKGLIPHVRNQLPWLTKPFSDADRDGYDLIIPTDLGAIGLQIKSSSYGKKVFTDRFLARDDLPYIACIVVNRQLSSAKVAERIRRVCWSEYYVLQKKYKVPTRLDE
jgi:hypothetical protein